MKQNRILKQLSSKKIFILLALITILLISSSLLEAKLPLWKIENGDNDLYLLGSVHIMPKEVYPLHAQINEVFDESEVLVVEVDATSLDQKAINSFIKQKAIFRDSTTLQDVIGEELYIEIEPILITLGFPKESIKRYRPWFIGLNLGVAGIKKLNLDLGDGIDIHFLNKAHERNMEIIELETATSQFEMLSSSSDSVQIGQIEYAKDNYEKAGTVFLNMLEAWKAGDTDSLAALSRERIKKEAKEIPSFNEYYDKLFVNRDTEFIKQIKELMQKEDKKDYLVIVGAFHLVGEDGVIARMREEGYTIEQLGKEE